MANEESIQKLVELISNPENKVLVDSISELYINALNEKYHNYDLFPDYDSWTVQVKRKSPGMFAVMFRGEVVDNKGEMVYEPLPSSRTKSFKKRTRFPLEKAISIAYKTSKEHSMMHMTPDIYELVCEVRLIWDALTPEEKAETTLLQFELEHLQLDRSLESHNNYYLWIEKRINIQKSS